MHRDDGFGVLIGKWSYQEVVKLEKQLSKSSE